MLTKIDSVETVRLAEMIRNTEGVVYYEPLKLKSGIDADFYLDIKKAYGDPDVLNLIVDIVAGEIKKLDGVTCIAASGHGGIPIVSVIESKLMIPMALLRAGPKNHGRHNWIDAHEPTKGDGVFVFDDVLTSGGSLKEVILKTVIEPGARLVGTCVVVDRGSPTLGFDVSYMLRMDEIKPV